MKITKSILEGLKEPKILYHGTNYKLPIGEQIDFNPKFAKGVDKDTEATLEKYRPKDKISRKSGFFLAVSPEECSNIAGGVDFEHYYKVKPIGQLDKHREVWMLDVDDPNPAYSTEFGKQLIRDYSFNVEDVTDELIQQYSDDYRIFAAKKYWTDMNGSPEQEHIEWIAKSIIVIEEVSQ